MFTWPPAAFHRVRPWCWRLRRRASLSICSNIAEGRGRRGDKEVRRFLDIAMSSACELECAVILAADLQLLDAEESTALLGPDVDVKRMLTELMQTPSRPRAKEPRPPP